MEQKTIDREKLTAYLLGKLSAEEQDAVAEQYFIDDEFYDQLLEVKADLIDQYARGQLPAADRRQFESYLDKLPDGWREVAVARAMAEVVDRESAVGKPATVQTAAASLTTKPVGWRQTLAGWLAQPVPALAMATGLIVLGGATIWLIQSSHDQEQLLAQMQQRDVQQTQSLREAERKLAEEQTSNAQLRQELERERQLRATAPSVQPPAISQPMIFWLLSSTVIRDPSQPSETVRLDPKAKTVKLTIPVRGKQTYTGYEVELKTEDGRQILWKDNQPNTPPMRSGQNIVFYRPAREFADPNSYKLTLTLISKEETRTRDYYFTVARR
jgi:anti-sigma factor RsiW